MVRVKNIVKLYEEFMTFTCKNKLNDATCKKYAGWGVCKGQYYDYMLKNCKLACNYCD